MSSVSGSKVDIAAFRGGGPLRLPGAEFQGHFQMGSYRYRSLIEGLYTL